MNNFIPSTSISNNNNFSSKLNRFTHLTGTHNQGINSSNNFMNSNSGLTTDTLPTYKINQGIQGYQSYQSNQNQNLHNYLTNQGFQTTPDYSCSPIKNSYDDLEEDDEENNKNHSHLLNDLNPLNNKISHTITQTSSIKQNRKDKQKPFNTFNQSQYEVNIYEDEIQKLKQDELESEINDKAKMITTLNSKNNVLSKENKALAKQINSLIEKTTQQEMTIYSLKTMRDQANDLEKELDYYTTEVSKLQEALYKKDLINKEFQSLAKETMSKFDHFEMVNNDLLNENKALKELIESNIVKLREVYSVFDLNDSSYRNEYLSKNNLVFYLNSTQSPSSLKSKSNSKSKTFSTDIDLELMILKEFFKERKVKELSELQHKENKLKDQIKETYEQQISTYKKEINGLNEDVFTLKTELTVLHKQNEALEKKHKDDDLKSKLDLDLKDKDTEQALITIKTLKKVIKDNELDFKAKLSDLQIKLKASEERERKLNLEIESKHKTSSEYIKELESMQIEAKIVSNSKETLEKKINSLESKIHHLENETNSLEQIIKEKNQALVLCDEKHYKEKDELRTVIEDQRQYQDGLINENDRLNKLMTKYKERSKELTELIETKYQGIEIEIIEEKNKSSELKQIIDDLSRKLKLSEEKNQIRINKLKKDFNGMEEYVDGLKESSEVKLIKVNF